MSAAVVQIARALDFAARKHSAHRRKGVHAEPYINHLAEVAHLLAVATDGQDHELIVAGLLHDTVEDTDTSYAEIEQLFGRPVADLVLEVTDDKGLPKTERKRRQVESITEKSERARLLKLADKTSNLRSLIESPPEAWSPKRQQEYFLWAGEVAAGCRGLNPFLEAAFDEAYAAAASGWNDGDSRP